MRRQRLASLVLYIFSSGLPVLRAQATGTIDGTVFDKSHAIVPAARITITNVNTNLVRSVLSDGAGQYTVPFLPVGVYNVRVEKEGFAQSLQQGIELQVNTRFRSAPNWTYAPHPSRSASRQSKAWCKLRQPRSYRW